MNAGTNRKSLRAEFERVVDLELSSLVRTAELVLKDPKPAEDLVVEAIVEAYRRRGRLPAPASNLRPELYRAMVDVMFSRFLPWVNPATEFRVDPINDRQPCEEYPAPLPIDLTRHEMNELVRELPHPLRLIVVLELVARFSYGEIADITGLHIDTVRSRMVRGRGLLGKHLCATVAAEGAMHSSQN